MSNILGRSPSLLRSIMAVFVGLVLISLIGETVEFWLVTAVNGGITTDNETYFAIRNLPFFLAAKALYNFLAGGVGGYVAAKMAGRAPAVHGYALAGIQFGFIILGILDPEFGPLTPVPVWVGIAVVTAAGIVAGARYYVKKASTYTLRK